MTKETITTSQADSEWRAVMPFGNGVIYANGDKRKVVTPGFTDFNYDVIPKPGLQQQKELPSPITVVPPVAT